jgi:hypothetical protein
MSRNLSKGWHQWGKQDLPCRFIPTPPNNSVWRGKHETFWHSHQGTGSCHPSTAPFIPQLLTKHKL